MGKIKAEASAPSPGIARDYLSDAVEKMPSELVHSEEGGEMLLYRAQFNQSIGNKVIARRCYEKSIGAVAGYDTARARNIRSNAEARLAELNG